MIKHKVIAILALVVPIAIGGCFCSAICAQERAAWQKDKRLVVQWVMSDPQNVGKLMDWCADNLTQEQINTLEVMMFPDLPLDQKAAALEMVKVQMQGYSLERLDDPDVKAAFQALDTAIANAKAITDKTGITQADQKG